MDDDKLLKEIKDSAEQVEIPQSLQPEEIRRKLENKGKKRKVIFYKQHVRWAAMVALLLVAILVGGPAIEKQRNSVADTATAETGTAQTADKGNEYSAMLHVENYQELYEMLDTDSRDAGFSAETPAFNPAVSSEEAAVEDYAPATGNAVQFTSKIATDTGENFSSADFSSTNIQEDNVDEGDIVKTDGKYIYILDMDGVIRIIEAESMNLSGKIPFEGEDNPQIMEMFVDGDVLQIIWSGFDYVLNKEENIVNEFGDRQPTRSYYSVPTYFTEVLTYDISDRSAPELRGTYRQDGRYLTSRKNREFLYVFTSFTPKGGHGVDDRGYYVPRAGDIYLPCERIYLPGVDRGGRYGGSRYLVGASLKADNASSAVDRMAVVSGAETFYVSEKSIYSATSRWDGDGDYTELVRLGYSHGIFTADSAGRIPGTLNNNFSMDEYQDNLRVVTTRDEEVKGLYPDQSDLVRSNGLYVLDGNLKVIGKLENLAKGESIESARFMGDTGYFVTYRNTDPLFTVDLSDPENPKVLNELKITGFSEYLHYYGENRLLGLGWETDPVTGMRMGLKCSMFDVSNPSNVRETDRLVLDQVGSCDALDNYKAILAEPEKNIFGFGYSVTNEENCEEIYYYGIFTYDEDAGFQALHYVKLPESIASGYIEAMRVRGLYIGDIFYLAGSRGIIAYDMKDDFRKIESFVWQD